MLFDSHCHLNDEQFADDLEDVVQRARAAGVSNIVVPGVDVTSSRRAIAIAEAYEGVYAAVGIHPEAAKDVPDADYEMIRELALHPKVVAIGEIGLDYYWDAAPRPVQQEVLRRQIDIARVVQLPVIIHNRDATEDTVSLLEEACRGEVRGVMHCFTGDWETAKRCIENGFLISFGGPVTFKNAEYVRETCAQIPSSKLLVETDSPYLSPHPLRGKRNEPERVRIVAERVAEVRSMSVEDLAQNTTANARALFHKVTS